VKRGADGRIDFLSPVPCPFNYGSILGTLGADGDPVDAVVLGPRLALGAEIDARVIGVVRFLDRGAEDDKWVCGDRASRREKAAVTGFFVLYGALKRVRGSSSGFRSVEWF
jgi:inorganic pyrophosphatase